MKAYQVTHTSLPSNQVEETLVSDQWQTYPLKSESLNGVALQDYACYVDNPMSIETDNAQSEVGHTWKKHCR